MITSFLYNVRYLPSAPVAKIHFIVTLNGLAGVTEIST